MKTKFLKYFKLTFALLVFLPTQYASAQTSCFKSGLTITVNGSSFSSDPPGTLNTLGSLNTSGCPTISYIAPGFGNGNGTSGFLTYSFSAPVTSARISYTAVNSAVGPGNGFDLGVITTSAGTPSLSNPCGVAIVNGNRIRGNNTNGPLGEAYVTVSSATPFTWIRLVGSTDDGADPTGFGQGNPCDFTVVPVCQAVTPTLSSLNPPTCSVPSGSFVINPQSGFQYGVDGVYQSSNSFSGIASGSRTISVKNIYNSSCTASAVITIAAVPSPPPYPNSSTMTNPTCANTSSGSITITPQTGVEYSLDGVKPYQTSNVFTGLSAGSYVLKVRSTTDNSCTAATAGYTLVLNQPAPIGYTLWEQPKCEKPTGSFTFATQPNVVYSINNGDNYFASPAFTGMAPNTTFQLKVRSTVDTSCTSGAVLPMNALTTPPSVPTTTSVTQPTCANPSSGSITITPQTGVEYSINNGGTYQASNVFTGLSAGSYTVRVRNALDTSCTAVGSTPITLVLNQPAGIGYTLWEQPKCEKPTGSFTFATQPNVVYSINDGADYYPNPAFTGMAPNTTFQLKVRSTLDTSCTSGAVLPMNALTTPPSVPTTTSVTQPTCANPSSGSITITPQTGVEYSINNGDSYQASNVFTGLSAGSYTVRVRKTSDNTCTAVGSPPITLVLNQPAGISYTDKTDPKCDMPTGSFTFATQPNVEYSINDGTDYFASPVFTGLAPNTNLQLKVRSTIDTTCTNAAFVEPIGGPATPPSVPTTTNVSQPTCPNPSSGSITITPQTGVEYSINNGGSYQASNVFNSLAAGSYTVRVRNALDTSCTAVGSPPITLFLDQPTANAGTDFTKTCTTNILGKSIGAPSVAGVTYSWSPATGLTDATVSNPSANPTATIEYTLTATNNASGCIATDKVLVTVNTTAPPTPLLTKTSINNDCPATSVNLNSLESGGTPGGATLKWYTDSTHTDEVATPTAVTTTGMYYPFYLGSVNGCYSSPVSTAVSAAVFVCCAPTTAPNLNN